MAITYRPTSTLSAALNSTDNEFNIASSTNVSVGDLLALRNEIMHVREIPVANRVKVVHARKAVVVITDSDTDDGL